MNEARNQTSIRAETVPSLGNGKQPPPVPPQQTPEELAVAHGIANYQRVVTERDELQKVVDRQEQMLTVAKIEIEGLRAELAAERSRMAAYQHERDDAVVVNAGWESFFIDINAMMRARGISAGPHIRKLDNENAS